MNKAFKSCDPVALKHTGVLLVNEFILSVKIYYICAKYNYS
jgi:hypothetical protein